jgi:hypothetical protein
MSGSIANLAVIFLALGTYGSLTFVIMLSAFKEVRGPESRYSANGDQRTARPGALSIQSALAAERHELDPETMKLESPDRLGSNRPLMSSREASSSGPDC